MERAGIFIMNDPFPADRIPKTFEVGTNMSAACLVAIIDRRLMVAECLQLALSSIDTGHYYQFFRDIGHFLSVKPSNISAVLVSATNFTKESECTEIPKMLNEEGVNAPVVVILDDIDHRMIKKCLDAGVKGVFPASMDLSLLPFVLGIVASGGGYVPATAFLPKNSEQKPIRSDASSMIHDTIVENVIRGMSNREIASQLGIREGIVKSRIRAISKKSGVRNRTELAVHRFEMERSAS